MHALNKKYNELFSQIADTFVKKHFTYEDGSVEDYYEIGDPHDFLPPDVIGVGDYFFDVNDMLVALMDDIPTDTIISWHDERTDHYMKEKTSEGFPNLKHYHMKRKKQDAK